MGDRRGLTAAVRPPGMLPLLTFKLNGDTFGMSKEAP